MQKKKKITWFGNYCSTVLAFIMLMQDLFSALRDRIDGYYLVWDYFFPTNKASYYLLPFFPFSRDSFTFYSPSLHFMFRFSEIICTQTIKRTFLCSNLFYWKFFGFQYTFSHILYSLSMMRSEGSAYKKFEKVWTFTIDI